MAPMMNARAEAILFRGMLIFLLLSEESPIQDIEKSTERYAASKLV
jgi:hypothetical protein